MQEQFQLVWANLIALGARRLAWLFLAAIVVFATIGLGARFLNKPAYETLYIGLERDDINRIGIVLSNAGINYDINSEGKSVLVEAGKASKARMILAEKGLPGSARSGYELFDNLGSLGLTSFMQEVTRVRVLEGEISRSIQAINGIKAARVHIVQPDRSSFSSRNHQATASVLVRTNGAEVSKAAFAIRHLVAAAVPKLSSENVTVLDASGRLLAAGEDPATTMLSSSISIRRMVEEKLKNSVSVALTPYLGSSHFRVNVQAQIDTDQRQTEETIFDPESRVERSVQVVKTQDSTSQKETSEPATVEQNLPNAEATPTPGQQSSQDSERREETTNYEVSSKKIAVVSNGFSVEKLSASIILNRAKLIEFLGSEATQEQIDQRLEEIKKVAMATVGFDAQRGDVIDVTAVDFTTEFAAKELPEPGVFERLSVHLGTMINAAAYLLALVLVLVLAVRPMIRLVSAEPEAQSKSPADNNAALPQPDQPDRLAAPEMEPSLGLEAQLDEDTNQMIATMKKSPQERLEALADEDEELSAHVLRQWINSEAA